MTLYHPTPALAGKRGPDTDTASPLMHSAAAYYWGLLAAPLVIDHAAAVASVGLKRRCATRDRPRVLGLELCFVEVLKPVLAGGGV